MIIPVRRDQQDSPWLKQAISGFPKDTPYIVAVNDGEVAEAVNGAAREATTKWILPFHYDDVPQVDMLDALLAYGFDADVIYPGVLHSTEDLESLLDEQPAQPYCQNRILIDPFIAPAAMILRDRFLELGGYTDEFAPLEHWDFHRRAAKAGWRFKACPEVYFYKRDVDGSRMKLGAKFATELYARITEGAEEYRSTFYFQATHATAYLRCVLPAKYLPAVARNDLYAHDNGEQMLEFPTHEGNTAVIQFAGDSTWAIYTHHLQVQGKRVLVEVDDNYLVDPGKVIRRKSNWGRNIGDAIHTFEGHRSIVKWADGVIVTTEHLGRAYAKFLGDESRVHVIPNPVDPVDWHFERPNDGIFRIGWFASNSHAGDGKLIERGLEWASKQPDVQIITLGYNPKWRFPYTHLPWVNDLSVWRMLNSTLDVGLCPVIAGHWSGYRSDIKASEYTMGGAAVIASDVPPYADWTDDFSIKAKTSKDFYNGLKRLVTNRDEAGQLQGKARQWVAENRDIRVLVEKWRDAVEV